MKYPYRKNGKNYDFWFCIRPSKIGLSFIFERNPVWVLRPKSWSISIHFFTIELLFDKFGN